MNPLEGIVFTAGDISVAVDFANAAADCTGVVAVRRDRDGTLTVISADQFYEPVVINGECRRVE